MFDLSVGQVSASEVDRATSGVAIARMKMVKSHYRLYSLAT